MRRFFLVVFLLSCATASAQQPSASVKTAAEAAPTSAVPVPAEVASRLDTSLKEIQRMAAQLEAAQQAYRALYFETMATLGLKPAEWDLSPDEKGQLRFVKRVPAKGD